MEKENGLKIMLPVMICEFMGTWMLEFSYNLSDNHAYPALVLSTIILLT